MADDLKQAADHALDVLAWDMLGIPKPARNIPTKQFVREAVRSVILPHLAPLIEAQVAQALGIKYLVTRDEKSGQFRTVQDGDDIGTATEIWTKVPSTPAFTDLMNRAIDKAKEQEQEIELNAKLEVRWKDTEE